MSRNFSSNLINRMPFTNPGAISNSGNKYFTNQRSKIFKLNLNILDNYDTIISYLNTKSSEQINVNSNKNIDTNIDGDFTSILSQQNNNSKTNKLNQIINQNNVHHQSIQSQFQL